jgi:signal recognition particle GTPase
MGFCLFDQLRKNVSKLIKKITITEISPKSVAKITKELNDILIKNEVAVATADAICEKKPDHNSSKDGTYTLL